MGNEKSTTLKSPVVSGAVIISILTVSALIGYSPVTETKAFSPKTASWAQPALQEMYNAKMIPSSLSSDSDFTENITREEFAELITTYFNKVQKQTSIPSSSDSKFTDTNNPLINLANKLGIVGGYPDGTFKPNATITRQEIAVMANQAEKQLSNIKQTKDVAQFSDKNKIASWATESVGSLSKAGGIGGYPDKTFKPTNKMTKQEAVSLVANLASKAGLTAIPQTPVVVGQQTVEQAQTLYKETMKNYPVTKGIATPVSDIKGFKVVNNGEPFEINGVTIKEIKTHVESGYSIFTPVTANGAKIDASGSFYAANGNTSLWTNTDIGQTGAWGLGTPDINAIKAVMFYTGQNNYILVNLQ